MELHKFSDRPDRSPIIASFLLFFFSEQFSSHAFIFADTVLAEMCNKLFVAQSSTRFSNRFCFILQGN